MHEIEGKQMNSNYQPQQSNDIPRKDLTKSAQENYQGELAIIAYSEVQGLENSDKYNPQTSYHIKQNTNHLRLSVGFNQLNQPNQNHKKGLIGQTLQLKENKTVRFYQEGNLVKANLDEKIGNFCRKLDLPVFWGNNLKGDQKINSNWLHIFTPEKVKDNQGYVYIDQPGLLGGMYNPGSKKMPPVDPEPEDYSSPEDCSSNDDSEPEKPSDTDDPSSMSDCYQEALEIEAKLKQRLTEVAIKKGLRLSQVNLIEMHLAEIKKAGKISKKELKKVKEELEAKINFVLNWNARSTLNIKCKGCKRQMGTDMDMLYHMEANIFGGPWTESDKYGNTKPNSPSYPNLRAYYKAHPRFKACFVPRCVYCYRDDKIASLKNAYESSRKQYEKLSQEYRNAARRTNRSARTEESIEKKIAKQQKTIESYKSSIESMQETAKELEKLRKESIVDYKNIPYKEFCKYIISEL